MLFAIIHFIFATGSVMNTFYKSILITKIDINIMKDNQKVYKLDIRSTLVALDINEIVVFSATETFPTPVRQIASDLKSKGKGSFQVSQNSITKEIAVKRTA